MRRLPSKVVLSCVVILLVSASLSDEVNAQTQTQTISINEQTISINRVGNV